MIMTAANTTIGQGFALPSKVPAAAEASSPPLCLPWPIMGRRLTSVRSGGRHTPTVSGVPYVLCPQPVMGGQLSRACPGGYPPLRSEEPEKGKAPESEHG